MIHNIEEYLTDNFNLLKEFCKTKRRFWNTKSYKIVYNIIYDNNVFKLITEGETFITRGDDILDKPIEFFTEQYERYIIKDSRKTTVEFFKNFQTFVNLKKVANG